MKPSASAAPTAQRTDRRTAAPWRHKRCGAAVPAIVQSCGVKPETA